MAASGDQRQELVTYSGQRAWARLREARTEAELRAHLQEAHTRGWRASVRGGGMAFDLHAIAADMVIQLRGFDAIGSVVAGTVTVGANASWGAILAVTRRAGYVPYVMVSTEHATAGGTLSADCLSRFSPTCGKEGNHVESFRLMQVDGSIVTCSRTLNAALFSGVISGFGALGVVLEVTYRLLHVGYTDIVVETMFTPFEGLAELAEALVTEVDLARALLRPDDTAPTSLASLANVTVADAHAVSAVIYMNDRRQGFVMRSSYKDGATTPLHPTPFHQPKGALHRFLQVLALGEATRRVGYWFTLNVFMARRTTVVDELEGFTFFQGGNDAIKRLGRKLGFAMGIRQQTYVVPRVPADPAASARLLASFLRDVDELLDARGLLPPLIDVLYLPDDAAEGFVLSSNHGISGYAVTITFEEVGRAEFPDEERALADISELCLRVGGRVHLVKNVHASAATLAAMYSWGLTQLGALRAAHDPTSTLRSRFLERVFPALP